MKKILLSLITIFAITTIAAQNIKENKTEEIESSISIHLSNMTAVVVNREIKVNIPAGTVLIGTMPNAIWSGTSGNITITLPLMMINEKIPSIDLLLQTNSGTRKLLTVDLIY